MDNEIVEGIRSCVIIISGVNTILQYFIFMSKIYIAQMNFTLAKLL